jgi:hypothetical protein
MSIDPVGMPSRGSSAPEQAVVSLDQRASGRSDTPSDPVLDAFYRALVDGGEHDDVFRFVKAYRDAQGEQPYRTNAAQMRLLQAVLARMKDEGLEGSELYRQTYKAFASVFGISAFITQFTADVFDTGAAEQQEEDNQW